MTSKKSAGVVAARTQQAAPAPGRGRSAAVAAGQEPDSAAAAAAGTDLVDGDGYGYGDSDGDGVDFVTFVVEGETYAFPMERVEEIIRMPQAVRMPLAPPSLEGLANLRGRVLPIVSLRSCCGLPPVEHDEATRVIVVDGGATLGFVVDRVASVTSVRAARIEPAERIGGSIDSELLSGVIRPDSKDDQLTKVLDVASLVAGQFALLGESSGRGGPGAGAVAVEGRAGVQQDRAEEADDDTLELVSFAVDGQEYALPIDLV
ncbi:MAG TPA: chemotaxis protein CheW, partial [Kineosporiaceae bacterium]|nr:chemotaxis protein CheW [Kineosporiaceae bacterium]